MTRSVAFVLKGYPRLSEAFIAQEIQGLEARGLSIRIISLRAPREAARHPIHAAIRASVDYLPEYVKNAPLRVLAAWWSERRRPGYRAARRAFLRDLRRDPTANRVRRFAQALVLTRELPPDVGRLHAHFLHTPASVTRYAALLLDVPWSVSAHAKDVWTTPAWEVRAKLAEPAWVATCTEANRAYLSGLADAPGKVMLAYHGLDAARFPPPAGRVLAARNGGDPADPVILLSVGRPVVKKGYDVLLDALARLGHLHWRLVHIGDGELLDALQAQAARLGLDRRIEWLGAQPHDEVLARYRTADVFVLASRVAPDGDRDGLPNVLMEAQSQELPCAATRVSAIPELILDGETGLLVPPEDAAALAGTLERLISDPVLRRRLGTAGARRVREHFDAAAGLDALAARFGLPVAGSRPEPAVEKARGAS